jgi:predicted porin
VPANATYRNASRFNAVLAYTSGPVRAGVEYFSANNWTAVSTKATGDKADGYSLFGSYQFQPEWGVFGRYDYIKPNKTTASTKKDDYFNFGVAYSPAKIVDLSLVYKRDKVDNGTFSTSNGTLGGTANGTYDELGIFAQYRW